MLHAVPIGRMNRNRTTRDATVEMIALQIVLVVKNQVQYFVARIFLQNTLV